MHYIVFLMLAGASSYAVYYDNGTEKEFYVSQNKLVSHLLSDYRKDMPPIGIKDWSDVEKPLIVNITLQEAKLLSVNEPFQAVDMIVEYYMESYLEWKDVRLTWNSTDFDGINVFVIDRNLIWTPDVAICNSRAVSERASVAQHLWVRSNGDINMYVYNPVSFLCLMNVRDFPFDKQVCSVEFASFAYSSLELILDIDISEDYSTTSVLILLYDMYAYNDVVYNTATKRNLKGRMNPFIVIINGLLTVLHLKRLSYTIANSAQFTFHMRRFPLIYVLTIILPSFVLTFLCVFVTFWSKFDKAEYLAKVGCGFSTILAMCTVLQIAEQDIPKTRELPRLAIYIVVNLLLVAVAVSIVTVASKPCHFPKFRMCRSLKGWSHRSSLMSEAGFRVVCLLLFSVATCTNLLILVKV